MKAPLAFFIVFAFFVLCTLQVNSQQRKADSLMYIVQTHKTEDTNLVWTVTRLAYVYMLMDDYTNAINNFEKGITLAKKVGFKSPLKALYANLGGSYWHIGNLPAALDSYFGLLKVSEETKDTGMIASAYHGIGLIYQSQENNAIALKNLNLAKTFYEKKGNKMGMAKVYNNIGALYNTEGRFEDALHNHLAALAIKKEFGDSVSIATSLNNIGLIYRNKNDFLTARNYYLQTYRILNFAPDAELMSSVSINLGNVYKHLGKPDSSRYYLNQALKVAKKSDYIRDISYAYSSLAALDSLEGNFKNAFENYKLYTIYHDSLINEDNTRKAVQTQMQYDFDKISAIRKAEQEKKDEISAAKTRDQRIILMLVAAALVIALVFAIFIFISYRQKQKANIELEAKNVLIEKQKEEVEYQKELVLEKQKEIIDSINYARRIQRAHLPTDKYVSKSLDKLKK